MLNMALEWARTLQIHSLVQTEFPVKMSASLTNFKGRCVMHFRQAEGDVLLTISLLLVAGFYTAISDYLNFVPVSNFSLHIYTK